LTQFDPAFEDVRQQLLDVRAGRSSAAAHGDVVEERQQRCRHRLFLGKTDAADCATRTRDIESCAHRLFEADALEDGVDAEAAGELAHALNASSPRSLTTSVAAQMLPEVVAGDHKDVRLAGIHGPPPWPVAVR
jgi:hypothetical protein